MIKSRALRQCTILHRVIFSKPLQQTLFDKDESPMLWGLEIRIHSHCETRVVTTPLFNFIYTPMAFRTYIISHIHPWCLSLAIHNLLDKGPYFILLVAHLQYQITSSHIIPHTYSLPFQSPIFMFSHTYCIPPTYLVLLKLPDTVGYQQLGHSFA